MKLYVCRSCDTVSKSDMDAQNHGKSNAHENNREYDLKDLLTRFLAQA